MIQIDQNNIVKINFNTYIIFLKTNKNNSFVFVLAIKVGKSYNIK